MTRINHRRHAVLNSILPFALVTLVAAASDTGSSRRAAFDAEDVLAKTRGAYAALTSYADSGTVLNETPGYTDRSTFRTLFTRDPSNLLIEYRALPSEYKSGVRVPLNNHVVLWMESNALQAWSSSTQEHETYTAESGQQVNALKNRAGVTAGISVLIPSHLYGTSGLASAVQATEEAEADGFETVNGRRCFRILGVERWRYPSGQVTGVRAITLWIDAETYLFHKVVQDTPKGMPRGSLNRMTTTIKHRVNPDLKSEQFRFAVPAS
jgi:hypothetical protein